MAETPISMRCPICGSNAHLIQERREVKYGRRRILVDDEFMRCDTCNETFYLAGQMEATDARAAEQARLELGALLPFEIRAIRESHGLTQAQFEKLLGVGPKTVVRWETGSVSPNAATNMLLRLLQAEPKNVNILRHWAGLDPINSTDVPASMYSAGAVTETAPYAVPQPSPMGYNNFWSEHQRSCSKSVRNATSDDPPYEEAVG